MATDDPNAEDGGGGAKKWAWAIGGLILAMIAGGVALPLMVVASFGGAAAAHCRAEAHATTGSTSQSGAVQFKVGTLNTLGATHTDPHGINDAGKRGYRPYTTRVPLEAQAVQRDGLSVLGMQEATAASLKLWRKSLPGWKFVGGGQSAYEYSVGYDASTWHQTSYASFTVPWINGHTQKAPVLGLANAQGQTVHIINIHGPASAYTSSDAGRVAEARAIARQVNKLTGPVLVTGDFNATMAGTTHRPNGAGVHPDRSIHTLLKAAPGLSSADPSRRNKSLDYVFGKNISFSAPTYDTSVHKDKATDHPSMFYATATIAGATGGGGFGNVVPGAGLKAGQVRLIQANMDVSNSPAAFAADLHTVMRHNPSIVTLEETENRSLAQMRVPGYDLYRPAAAGGNNDAHDETILWAKAKWHMVGSGSFLVSKPIPGTHIPGFKLKTDWRYANYVTLQSTKGSGKVSIIATHAMINPRHGSGQGARKAADRAGFEKIAHKAAQLQHGGPVIVSGDLNSVWGGHQAWNPRPIFAGIANLTGTFSVLGTPGKTDDHGGDPDQIYASRGVQPISQGTFGLHSDHRGVTTVFKTGTAITGPTGPAAPAPHPAPAPASTPQHSPVGTNTVASTGTSAAAGPTTAGSTIPFTTTFQPTTFGSNAPKLTGADYTVAGLKLSPTEYKVAQYVTAQAQARGGTQAAIVADTTALTESTFNPDAVNGGTYGVFQQTPAYYGGLAATKNVQTATNAFLNRLLAVPGWQTMPPWEAAQAVQNSGAGQASNGADNYGPNVRAATAIVNVLGGGAANAVIGSGFSVANLCPGGGVTTAQAAAYMSAGGKGSGGNFTPSTIPYVGPYNQAQLMTRVKKYVKHNHTSDLDPYFHSVSGDWYDKCMAFAGMLENHQPSGYADPAVLWSDELSRGQAHPAASADGMSPPVGALLIYKTSKVYGHVTVYLGNNQVASTDTWGTGTVNYGPASAETNGPWHLQYLGWVAPYSH